nr:hypothetical protein [Tanacetum cinerariifolium]
VKRVEKPPVNDAMGSKKKTVVVTSDPLALIAEKTKVSKIKRKLLFLRTLKEPTNNNLRTSSSSQSANKKQEFVKTGDKKEDKKADEKKRDTSKVKCYNCKKEGHFAKDCKKAKKTIVVTSDPLALIAEKINVSRSKEKVVVSLDSEGSEADDFSELKKITALLAKAFNQRKFYSKPTNNNLRTSSSSQSENKKQEFVKTDNKRVEKKYDEKKRDMSKVKCYNCKKEGHFAKDCKKAK